MEDVLNSSDISKFYKMRKCNVLLTFENKILVGNYLSRNIKHLSGLAFAFNKSPHQLIMSCAGAYCYSLLNRDGKVSNVLDIDSKTLLQKDLAYIIYRSLLDDNAKVINHIKSLFGGDIYDLGSTKLTRYLLSDIRTPEAILANSLKNSRIDDHVIGTCVLIKQEHTAESAVRILLDLIPRLSIVQELHLFLLNTIIYLITKRPMNISLLLDLFISYKNNDDSHLFQLAAYCWFYKIEYAVPKSQLLYEYFQEDKIINHYILFVLSIESFKLDYSIIAKIVNFIMGLDTWPIYFKTIIKQCGFVQLSQQYANNHTIVSSDLDIAQYPSKVLDYCQSWLTSNNDPLLYGYLIQSTLEILQDTCSLKVNNLLRPFLSTNFKSNISHCIDPVISNYIDNVCNTLPSYLRSLLLLYAKRLNTKSAFEQLLSDAIVFAYFPLPTPLKSPSIPPIHLTSPTFYQSVYFQCKFKFTSIMHNNLNNHAYTTENVSFYEYFKDLAIYHQYITNPYELFFIFEHFQFLNQPIKFNLDSLPMPFNDIKMGLQYDSETLTTWDPIYTAYNQCCVHICDYPLDVPTLKELKVKDVLYDQAYIKACKQQQSHCSIRSTDVDTNILLIKYYSHQGHVAKAQALIKDLSNKDITPVQSKNLKLQHLKLKQRYKLDNSFNIINEYKAMDSDSKVYKRLGDYCSLIYNNELSIASMIIEYYSKYLELGSDDQYVMIPKILALVPLVNNVDVFIDMCHATNFKHILPHVHLLSSNLTTTNELFKRTIEQLIEGLIKNYHKQVGWYLCSTCFSTNTQRANDMTRILKTHCKTYKIGSWMNLQVQLCQYLIALSEMDVNKQISELDLKKDFKKLSKLVNLDILVPNTATTIHKFVSKVIVMNSLVRPKRIEMLGHDGMVYPFMVKKDEDLRKDLRYLEIAKFVNLRLNKTTATRQRQMSVRTYHVIVLNEVNGLIEWMNHTETIRKCINAVIKVKGIKLSHTKLKRRLDSANREAEFNKILQEYPAVLHYYLLNLFPSPEQYFEARMRFSRSCAVMSMVGYALGLGDRHCENIMIDALKGDVVHVDFNCLFEKGKRLSIPEVVPFRLTQNMVRVMGITGYEGPYRKACELTLDMMRKQYYLINTILDSFLNDPLIEWMGKKGNASAEELAAIKLNQVKNRVFGGMELSVEGTVHMTIMEATSSKNLSEMYYGWMPYF